MFKRISLIFLFVLGINLLSFGQSAFKENLPEDWSIHKYITLSADQVTSSCCLLGFNCYKKNSEKIMHPFID